MNKYLAYLLLLLPLVGVFFFGEFNQGLEGDEPRYLGYANNLLNGFYANPNNPELTNGPGYPLFIALLL